ISVDSGAELLVRVLRDQQVAVGEGLHAVLVRHPVHHPGTAGLARGPALTVPEPPRPAQIAANYPGDVHVLALVLVLDAIDVGVRTRRLDPARPLAPRGRGQ